MIEIKVPEKNETIIELPNGHKVTIKQKETETIIELPNGHKATIKQNMVDLAIEAYNMGYKDGVEAYKAMMEIEREEKEGDAE